MLHAKPVLLPYRPAPHWEISINGGAIYQTYGKTQFAQAMKDAAEWRRLGYAADVRRIVEGR